MRDPLAERLLAQVMNWSEEDVAHERPVLQSMAAYKYDEYQQFIPGMRFVESLALWLGQFETLEEKIIAYEFVKTKLIFYSTAEINHLVEVAYPDFIRPQLIKKVARENDFHPWQVEKISCSREFRIAQRKTLFLGLSDGARTDVFRRFNRELSHEQIYPTYEISNERADSLLADLRESIGKMSERSNGDISSTESCQFETIVLLDDFSGSGLSYIRENDEKFSGKVAKLHKQVTDLKYGISSLFDAARADIYIVLYLATEQARQNLEQHTKKLWQASGTSCSVIVIHQLNSEIKLVSNGADVFNSLIENYYDDEVEDQHTKVGGSDVKFGFASCGLPLVLSHNTPNNSLALLWAETERVRALFPRVKRHK